MGKKDYNFTWNKFDFRNILISFSLFSISLKGSQSVINFEEVTLQLVKSDWIGQKKISSICFSVYKRIIEPGWWAQKSETAQIPAALVKTNYRESPISRNWTKNFPKENIKDLQRIQQHAKWNQASNNFFSF